MRKCQRHAQLQAAHCLARGFHLQERSFQLRATSWADTGITRAAGRSGSGSFSCALRSSARSPSHGQHSVAGWPVLPHALPHQYLHHPHCGLNWQRQPRLPEAADAALLRAQPWLLARAVARAAAASQASGFAAPAAGLLA